MRGSDGRWAAVALIATAVAARAAGAATIEVGSATLPPGASTPVTLSLGAAEKEAAIATENRLEFTRSAYVAARQDGESDCAVEPSIDKQATGSRFLPLGCDAAVDCTGIRASASTSSSAARRSPSVRPSTPTRTTW